MIKRCLISVSDKTGLESFARGLVSLGIEIISTGGTASFLREKGIPVTNVADYTGFPEIFGGRIKTLHPKIEGGIICRWDNPSDIKQAAENGIEKIDMVVVNLYPFKETAKNETASFNEVIEQIDIGGPTMIRAAAKNYPHVIVVCDPADYDTILYLLQDRGDVPEPTRQVLAQKVFECMADYDGAISKYFGDRNVMPADYLQLLDGQVLAYGENRYQSPAYIYSGGSNNPLALSRFEVKAGQPSFIAMADASELVSTLCLMAECFRRSYGYVPNICIAGKHGNACGAAISWDNPVNAILQTLMGDTDAVMGGELIVNFPINEHIGQLLYGTGSIQIGRPYWGLDVILAPSISDETVELMGKKEKRRILINEYLSDPPFPEREWVYRYTFGGDWLKQRAPNFVLSPKTIVEWVGKPIELNDPLFDSLIVAFACCWRGSSNTVSIARNNALEAMACGQQDRRAGGRLCNDRAIRAGHGPKGSVFASDGFFPFATQPNTPQNKKRNDRDFKYLMELTRELDGKVKGARGRQEKLSLLYRFADRIAIRDRREGTEILRDAGCIGGVVPADGKELPNVKQFFTDAGMRVAFVAAENRGFAKHGDNSSLAKN